MNNVTVDSEMKNRIMGAVSAAIKEQAGSAVVTDIPKDKNRIESSDKKGQARKAEVKPAETRKKAKKTPIALISSIAAGVLVIAGALFVVNYLNKAQSASKSIDMHNDSVEAATAATEANAVEEVFENVYHIFSGYNNLIGAPLPMVTVLSMINAAHQELHKDNFNYSCYRKLILDAGNEVLKIKEV